MDATARIEQALEQSLAAAEGPAAPPKLAAAIRYALFPGGARVRPHLCLAVAAACGDRSPVLADGAAAAIELIHCASLVHDDLPCFDDAEMRRGKPSVHRAFGEPLAVLAGDAMIVMAFETLARAGTEEPSRLAPLLLTLGRATGLPGGIAAGQGWESEPVCALEPYQAAKTGALFVAATMSGAIAAGADPEPWRRLGMRLGDAYQVADDLSDAAADPAETGKPAGRDRALGRPSIVAERGVDGALSRLKELVGAAIDAVPACDGAAELRDLVLAQAVRLAPKKLLRSAA